MTYPSRPTTIAILREWKAMHDVTAKMMDDIQRTIGLEPGSVLFDGVWNIFDAYTRATSAQVGDFGDWLEWYYLEADMGNRPMEAGYSETMPPRPINSLARLAALIFESRKRQGI